MHVILVVTCAEPEHPFASVTVTLNIPAVVTDMVGVVADVDHKYFAKPAPAFSIVELPPQNDVSPLIAGFGFGLTVIVNVFGVPGQAASVIKLPRLIGPLPTVTVPTTVFVAVLITDKLSERALLKYTFIPSGLTDMP